MLAFRCRWLNAATHLIGDRVELSARDAPIVVEIICGERWSSATPNIPPKSNRHRKPCFSKRLYRERNLVERFFFKLKHFRRIAIRYDKLAANFLAIIQLASMRL